MRFAPAQPAADRRPRRRELNALSVRSASESSSSPCCCRTRTSRGWRSANAWACRPGGLRHRPLARAGGPGRQGRGPARTRRAADLSRVAQPRRRLCGRRQLQLRRTEVVLIDFVGRLQFHDGCSRRPCWTPARRRHSVARRRHASGRRPAARPAGAHRRDRAGDPREPGARRCLDERRHGPRRAAPPHRAGAGPAGLRPDDITAAARGREPVRRGKIAERLSCFFYLRRPPAQPPDPQSPDLSRQFGPELRGRRPQPRARAARAGGPTGHAWGARRDWPDLGGVFEGWRGSCTGSASVSRRPVASSSRSGPSSCPRSFRPRGLSAALVTT